MPQKAGPCRMRHEDHAVSAVDRSRLVLKFPAMLLANITILPDRVVDDDDALDVSRQHDRVAVKCLMQDHW